jgi:tRNA(adenine34) deaminase
MGGVSKWPVLTDTGLSDTMPEVFAAPPQIVAGFMEREAEDALMQWNAVIAGTLKRRGLLVAKPETTAGAPPRWTLMGFLRRQIFDRFGRR